MKKKTAQMNMAYAVGLVTLDRAKEIMFREIYETLIPFFKSKGSDIDIAMSDTDCLLFQVNRTKKQILSDLKELEHHFDFSNLDTSHPLYNLDNRSKLFKWKIETGSDYDIVEVVALRSKCYSLLLQLRILKKKINHLQKKEKSFLKEQKTVKGIKKSAIKNSLTFQKFKETLFLEKRLYTTFQKIQSKKHVLKTVKLKKQSLTSFDDKRYLLPCDTHTVIIVF